MPESREAEQLTIPCHTKNTRTHLIDGYKYPCEFSGNDVSQTAGSVTGMIYLKSEPGTACEVVGQ